jgi:hypothetical protein
MKKTLGTCQQILINSWNVFPVKLRLYKLYWPEKAIKIQCKGLIRVKRKLSLLLSLIFIFMLATPVWGMTASMDKGLENAIKIAKTKFAIPDDYKFTSSIGTSGGKQVYRLSWDSKDTINSTSIYVCIDENGMITEYNKYSRDDYKTDRKNCRN